MNGKKRIGDEIKILDAVCSRREDENNGKKKIGDEVQNSGIQFAITKEVVIVPSKH